jgi:ParB family chromosome partitioning protein
MSYENNSIFWVEVDKIVPNAFQPRREFNEQSLKELAESIRMYGILQPLTVIRSEVQLDDGAFRTEYELIAGERRLRASKIAGLRQVPVIIRSGEETSLMKLELAIIENLQREDLNPIDRALAFKQLADQFKLNYTEVAKKVGRSRMFVSNSIRLLNLPDTIMSAVSQGEISDGHARALLMLSDRPEEQDVVFREILLKKLSVRDVEAITRKIAVDKTRKKVWKDTDPALIEIEKKFTETLGTRVQIAKTDYGGKVVIDYFSDEDLEQLLERVHQRREAAASAVADSAAMAAIANATAIETVDENTEEQGRDVQSEATDAENGAPRRVAEEGAEGAFDDAIDPDATPEDDTPPAEARRRDEEDDELYSLKNFSL